MLERKYPRRREQHVQRHRGNTDQFSVPGMAGAWGEIIEDEDKLGLAPVYKGPFVTKLLALDPGDKRKHRDF